jgi:transketolase
MSWAATLPTAGTPRRSTGTTRWRSSPPSKPPRQETDRPSIIACKTHIGYGSPNKQDTSSAHGSPLGWDEIKLTKENLDWPTEPLFYVADGVTDFLHPAPMHMKLGRSLFAAYQEEFPEDALAFTAYLNGDLPANWDQILPTFDPEKAIATRAASGTTLNAIAPHVPYLLGGSADLTGSNKTGLKGAKDLDEG